MLGTWANVGAIVLGALVGVAIKRGLPEHVTQAVLKVEGVTITVIGLWGILVRMVRVDPETGRLSDSGSLLLLVSLVIGCVCGELLRIDDRLGDFGRVVETRMGAAGFAAGFVTASLVFSIGAMGIIGALNDGLRGDSSVLLVKSMLDGTTSIVLASTLGIGVLFSAVPVLVLQGAVSLLAGAISPFVTDPLLDVFCMVGYALVLCIGLNFLAEVRIKVANLLPSLLVPVCYHFLFVA